MIRIFIIFIPAILSFLNLNNDYIDYSSEIEKPIVRFGVVSDVQYCDCTENGIRYYDRSLDKLREAVSDFNNQSLDFLINLGDLIDRDFISYSSVLPILDSSQADIYHTLGNHDFEIEESEKNGLYRYLKTGKEGYYSFEVEEHCFIVLNSNDISRYSPSAEKREEAGSIIEEIISQKGINGYEWNGAIGNDQQLWLTKRLKKASKENKKVILFSHHPVWPQSTLNILNYLEMLDLVAQFDNVIGWFSGHKHDGGYGNFNNVHCVNFRGMVDTEDTNSYAIVEIYENKIWITGCGREKSQILAY